MTIKLFICHNSPPQKEIAKCVMLERKKSGKYFLFVVHHSVMFTCTVLRKEITFKSGTQKAIHIDETCLFIAYFMSQISLCSCCPIGLLMGIDLCLFL